MTKKSNKWFALALSALAAIGLTACGNQNDDLNSQIEGGEFGRIAATYVFDNPTEFCAFYNQFKENNPQRYLIPLHDNPALPFECIVTAEGVLYRDYVSQRYDIVFPFPGLYINISFTEAEIEGRCFDVSSFVETLPLELSYKIDDSGRFSIFANESQAIYSATIKTSEATCDEAEIAEAVLSAFKKGAV